MKIENIKARCAPIVYIMLQRIAVQKRPIGHITRDLEHKGTGTGGWRGDRTKDKTSDQASTGESKFKPHPTGSTSYTAGSE